MYAYMRKNNIFDSCHLPTMIFSRPRFHERDAWAAVKGVWSSLFALRPWVSLAKASLVWKEKNLEHGTLWSLVLTETTSTESTMFEKMLKLNSYWSFGRNRVVSHNRVFLIGANPPEIFVNSRLVEASTIWTWRCWFRPWRFGHGLACFGSTTWIHLGQPPGSCRCSQHINSYLYFG